MAVVSALTQVLMALGPFSPPRLLLLGTLSDDVLNVQRKVTVHTHSRFILPLVVCPFHGYNHQQYNFMVMCYVIELLVDLTDAKTPKRLINDN